MIVRAALAALACLAARVAGQFKVCDPSFPEIIFTSTCSSMIWMAPAASSRRT